MDHPTSGRIGVGWRVGRKLQPLNGDRQLAACPSTSEGTARQIFPPGDAGPQEPIRWTRPASEPSWARAGRETDRPPCGTVGDAGRGRRSQPAAARQDVWLSASTNRVSPGPQFPQQHDAVLQPLSQPPVDVLGVGVQLRSPWRPRLGVHRLRRVQILEHRVAGKAQPRGIARAEWPRPCIS